MRCLVKDGLSDAEVGRLRHDMTIYALWGFQLLGLEPPQCIYAVLTYVVLQTVS